MGTGEEARFDAHTVEAPQCRIRQGGRCWASTRLEPRILTSGSSRHELRLQDTSTWSGKPGALVVTTGKQAPDGSVNAAKLANTATGVGVEDKELGSTSGASLAVGDWFVAGYWRRWTPIDAAASTTSPLR